MPKQIMYVSHETHEVMTGREARKRYRKRYTTDQKLKYHLSEKRKGLYLYCSRME